MISNVLNFESRVTAIVTYLRGKRDISRSETLSKTKLRKNCVIIILQKVPNTHWNDPKEHAEDEKETLGMRVIK